MTTDNRICPACGQSSLQFFRRQGKYRCTDIDCGEEFAPEQLQSAEGLPQAGPDLLETVPFPVAFPLAHARDTRLPARDRAANAIFAGYQAMRTTALLLLADYLACETVCRQLQGPIRGLRLPHWSEWAQLCDRLCQFWSGRLPERPERETHLPHLVTAWLEVNRHGKLPKGHPWTELLAGLSGLQGPAQSLNDALWKARNVRAHREATRTVEEGDERAHLPRLLAVTEAMAQRLFPSEGLTLWRRIGATEASLDAICLHGPHLDLRFVCDDSPEAAALNWGSTGLLVRTPTADLPVYPLFVPLDAEGAGQCLPGGGLVEPVGLVDGISEKKIAVLGVRSHFELPELAGPIQAALTRKEVQLGYDRAQTKRWSLVSWATVTAEDTLNALRGRKYLPDVYLERAGVDGRVGAVLERPGRGLLLLGEAGAGKSSLLARLVDHLLAAAHNHHGEINNTQTWLARRGRGDVVLFLSGTEAYQGDAAWSGRQLLCEAVLRRAGIASGAFTDLDDLCHHLAATVGEDQEADRRVWLILDALNEAARFTDLLKALDDLLPALGRHPWLRLVVSLRSGAYHALAQRHRDLLQHGNEVLSNARYLAAFTDTQDREVPYLELRPFTAAETAAAYTLRRELRPDQSCPLPYERLLPSLRELLRAPLYLHLFHETCRGRTDPPQDLDEGRLLGAYLDRLETDLPGIASYLQRLGRLMYERRLPILPVAEADAWVAEWRARLGADNALRVVKLDPVEELVAASLLMRPAEEGEGAARRLTGYGFTQQRLCEQVLLRELRRQIHPRTRPTAAELLVWARQADGPDPGQADDFQELTGALETLTAELAQAGAGEVLAALLDLEGEPVRTRLLGRALQALGPLGRDASGTVAAVIDSLVALAITAIPLGKRCNASVWQAERWLTEYGYSPVAWQLAQGRLQVMRTLVSQGSGRTDLWRDLAVSLDNLGNLAEAAGDGAGARGYFAESLKVMRTLLAKEPGRADLWRDLSVSLNNLGNLAQSAGDGARARGYFAESLKISRALVAKEPARADLRRDLAVALSNLGNLAQAEGKGSAARSFFTESLEVVQTLVVQTPGRADLRRDLAVAFSNLGHLARAAGDWSGARGFFEKDLEISRALVTQEPGRADLWRDLSVSLNNLGRLARAAGDGTVARGFFEEMLEAIRALVAQEPGRADLRRDLAAALSNLGQLAQAAGDGAGTRGYFAESLDVMRALVAQEPGRVDLRRDLLVGLSNFGQLAQTTGDWVEARSIFDESLEISRALVAQEPGRADLRRDLAAALSNLGQLAQVAGDGAGAWGYFAESLEILSALVAQEPGRADLQQNLSVALNNCGRLARAAGDRTVARGYFAESLEIMQALVAQEPERADRKVDLAIGYWNQYQVAERGNERRWLGQVIDTLRPLRECGVLHYQLDQYWRYATEALSRLGDFG